MRACKVITNPSLYKDKQTISSSIITVLNLHQNIALWWTFWPSHPPSITAIFKFEKISTRNSDITNSTTLRTIMSNDMTVEDFLKARCLSLAGEINSFGDKLENKLRQEFEDGKKELLSVHRQCVEGFEESGGVADMDCTEAVDKENDPESGASTQSRPSRSASTAAASATRSTRKKAQPTVHVLVEAGPHANLKAVLKPTKATASMVGRSTGKKFREKGLSLSKVRESVCIEAQILL